MSYAIFKGSPNKTKNRALLCLFWKFHWFHIVQASKEPFISVNLLMGVYNVESRKYFWTGPEILFLLVFYIFWTSPEIIFRGVFSYFWTSPEFVFPFVFSNFWTSPEIHFWMVNSQIWTSPDFLFSIKKFQIWNGSTFQYLVYISISGLVQKFENESADNNSGLVQKYLNTVEI